jgi:hypothetical protein
MAITISGSGITSANIADGTIVNADVADVAASKLTGALPAIDGSALTNLPASGFGANEEIFTTSGTWNWANAGSPSVVWVWCVGGQGGYGGYSGYGGYGGGIPGAGGMAFEILQVSGNITYSIGAGGAGGAMVLLPPFLLL